MRRRGLLLALGLLLLSGCGGPSRPAPTATPLAVAVGARGLAAAPLLLPLPAVFQAVPTTPAGAALLLERGRALFAAVPGSLVADLPTDVTVVGLVAAAADSRLLWTVPRLFHWADAKSAAVIARADDLEPLWVLARAYRDVLPAPPLVEPGTSESAEALPPGLILLDEPYASMLAAQGRFRPAAFVGAELGPYPGLVLVTERAFAAAHPLLVTELLTAVLRNAWSLRLEDPSRLAAWLRPAYPTVSPSALSAALLLMRRLGLFPDRPTSAWLFRRMAAVDPEGPWAAGLRHVDDRYAEDAWLGRSTSSTDMR